MALLNRFKVCQDSTCESLTVTDITGLYDAATNTGGFGDVNDSVGDITVATIDIIPPDSTTTYTFDLLTDTSHDWPTVDVYEFEILTVSLDANGDLVTGAGGLSQLTDGTYDLTYTLTGPGGTVVQKGEVYLHCASTTLVYNMFADLDISDCNCNSEALEKALYAWGLHEALKCAVSCSQDTKVIAIQAALNKIGNNTNNCSTC
jgi:hypothetical protein